MIFNHAHIAPWSRFLIFVSLTSAVTAAYAQTSVQEEPTRRSEPASVAIPAAPVHTENDPAGYTRWAVETNLLLLAAGVPNLGAELRLGERFSLAANAAFTNWRIESRRALQINKGSAELKYWFAAAERPFTGWYCGAWGTLGGRYNVQWNSGWQGDRFYAAGITGGRSFAVGRRLNIEVSASAGWFHTPEARHYHSADDVLIWQQTRYNTGSFMFKCAVGLVWLPGKEK